MAKVESKGSGIASALKEQLALLTFIVLFGGLVATETYYAGFGIRYQVMEFSLTHLIYRGLTATLDSPWLIIAYVAATAWLASGAEWFHASSPRFVPWVQPVTYILVTLVIVTAYFAAIAAGANSANKDLAAATSRLPVIRALIGKDANPLPFEGYRLLFAGTDSVILFKPTRSPAEVPFIHLLKRDDIDDITFTR